jgi:anti-sigma factor RsiW
VGTRVAASGGAATFGGGCQISEADLHGYIDGDPTIASRVDIEAFLAAHPLIAERVETYRTHIIAVNAAFGAREDPLPPGLAQLASRYARAEDASLVIGTTLAILGFLAILCVIAGAAHGA